MICPGMAQTPLLNGISERLYRKDAEQAQYHLYDQLVKQPADILGKCIVETSASAKNGTIWIIDNGQAREVVLPNYWLPN